VVVVVVVAVVVGRIVRGNDEEGVFSRINFSHFLLIPRIKFGCLFYFTVLY